MPEKELLKEQLEQLSKLTTTELSNWRSETLPIVATIFGEKSSQYTQFRGIGQMSYTGYEQQHIESFKNCLSGMIKCLDIKKSNTNNDSNLKQMDIIINNNPSFNQSQSQNQNQSLSIEDIIKDEIPPARLREIQKIVNSNEPKESKLNKICEILQKTGIEIVSSTLAKVITCSMGIY